MERIDLEKIPRLSQIEKNEDIKSLSYAIFPGTHCPLFGVAMIASYIEDMAVLVVGTQECTYYSKNFAHGRQRGKDNFYSLVTNKHDVTFGLEKKVIEVIKEIDRELNPNGIMVVSTCVLEVIGEDLEGIISSLELELRKKVVIVPTEHFKCNSHIPGMERALEKLVNLMELPENKRNRINILGHRQHGVENTELVKVLQEVGIEINTVIPSSSTIEELKTAPEAKLNIVTDPVALPLAKKMEEFFGVPYVEFQRNLTIDKIRESYQKIEGIFNVNLLDKLQYKEEELKNIIEKAKKLLDNKTFIYGNTPMNPFQLTCFLTELGLRPLMIGVRELSDNDHFYINKIKKGNFNPYICRIANIAPMGFIYDQLKPHFYIGHENPMNLMKRGIIQVTLDEVTKNLGYDVALVVVKKLLASLEKVAFGQRERGVNNGIL